jgi:hypothetical protein
MNKNTLQDRINKRCEVTTTIHSYLVMAYKLVGPQIKFIQFVNDTAKITKISKEEIVDFIEFFPQFQTEEEHKQSWWEIKNNFIVLTPSGIKEFDWLIAFVNERLYDPSIYG